MTSRRAFTLIEILVSVMLTGLLASLALAPVASTVRRTVDTQREYADISALSRVMSFIARDLSCAMRMSPTVLKIEDKEARGGKDTDILIFMSTSPSSQGMPPGSVIYAVTEGGILHGDILPGLYRWILPGVDASDVKTDTLNPSDAQLVLPGVDEFCAEVPKGSHEDDRQKEYTGQLPTGIYIKIGRGAENDEDRTRRVESVISLP